MIRRWRSDINLCHKTETLSKETFLLKEFPVRTIIERGYFNSVFKSTHSTLGHVSLKLLRFSDDTRELPLASQLQPHRNVLSILGSIYYDNVCCGYAMELMETSLHKVIHNKTDDSSLFDYSLLDAIAIVEKICSGVQFLKKNEIKYVCVSPKRAFLSNNLQVVKVSAFGYMPLAFGARSVLIPEKIEPEPGSEFTCSTNPLLEQELTEIFPYVAPESIPSCVFDRWLERNPYSEKWDSYSMAVTCCELFLRERPYGEIEYKFLDLLHNKINEHSLRPNCSQLDYDVKQLIQSAWHKEYNERPTITVLHANFKRLLAARRRADEERRAGLLERFEESKDQRGKKDGRVEGEVKQTDGQASEAGPFGKERRFLRSEAAVIATLGSGEEGLVISHKHPTYGQIAVKMMKTNESEIKELRLAMKLRPHPNVVSVFGFLYNDENDTIPRGYVMENLFTSLDKVIYKTKTDKYLPEYGIVEAKEIILKICCGIHFLHQQGILHRDIKPENILSSKDLESIKLCDFGRSTTLCSTLSMGVGSPMYMAPEVLRGDELLQYSEKCDVFSAAISFWELIHRRTPYDLTGNRFKLADDVVQGYRPSLEGSPLNDRCKQLLRSAWREDPTQRLSIFELSQGLANGLN